MQVMRPFVRSFWDGFSRGLGIALGMVVLGGFSLLLAQSLTSFQSGELISASKINANFSLLSNSIPPVGTIQAWHKDMPGVSAALPSGWVECNGQVLNDTASALHGQTIPNLNGDSTGADSPNFAAKERLFLRGGTTSGTGEADMLGSHSHSMPSVITDSAGGGWWINSCCVFQGTKFSNTNATGGVETRPKSMSVIWIMRVR